MKKKQNKLPLVARTVANLALIVLGIALTIASGYHSQANSTIVLLYMFPMGLVFFALLIVNSINGAVADDQEREAIKLQQDYDRILRLSDEIREGALENMDPGERAALEHYAAVQPERIVPKG